MHIASIGIDLGKTTFHLVVLGERSKVLLWKKYSRAQILAYTANRPSSQVGLEACSGAHFLGSKLREQGHDVRLIPAHSPMQVLVPASPDFITETFAIAKDGKNIVVSYMQPSRSLMIADGVSGVSAPSKTQ